MNSIKQMAAKFRHAAEVLEELAGIDRPTFNETPDTAHKLRNSMKKARGKRPGKPYYKKGTHWTQKPENKAKLKKMHQKGAETRSQLRGAA